MFRQRALARTGPARGGWHAAGDRGQYGRNLLRLEVSVLPPGPGAQQQEERAVADEHRGRVTNPHPLHARVVQPHGGQQADKAGRAEHDRKERARPAPPLKVRLEREMRLAPPVQMLAHEKGARGGRADYVGAIGGFSFVHHFDNRAAAGAGMAGT